MAETTRYAAAGILDTWVSHDWTHGIQLGTLRDFCEIEVETENTLYEITVIDSTSREVVVRGGHFFPEKTAAKLAGSSFVKIDVRGHGVDSLNARYGAVQDPAVLVLRPPDSLVVRIDGFADRDTVAQAADNAAS